MLQKIKASARNLSSCAASLCGATRAVLKTLLVAHGDGPGGHPSFSLVGEPEVTVSLAGFGGYLVPTGITSVIYASFALFSVI
jgi:hypothetical protein